MHPTVAPVDFYISLIYFRGEGWGNVAAIREGAN
jgi:hypothetical protein